MRRETKEIRVLTVPIEPTEFHKGWVELSIRDVHGHFTKSQVKELRGLIQDDMLPSSLAGYQKLAGVFDYDEKYFGIDFLMPIPQSIESKL